ncbi:MAG: pyridoxal phosphate-dependent aminotransferase [Gammaproteobacteria bacterium]|nr:pyridoxal phosphate-dependent aminotransferase [Gammaproteobacteria bacterium]
MSPFRPEIEALEQNGITRVALPRITDPKVIPLWFGEGDAVTPQFIRDAAKAALDEGQTFYSHTRGRQELRDAIKDYLDALYGVDIDPARITVPGAAMMGITIAAQMALTTGDHGLIVSPNWPNIETAYRVTGAEVGFVRQREGADGWQLGAREIIEQTQKRTRAIFVNSPCNPTGWIMQEDDQRELLEFCRARNILLIADEVYGRLVYDRDIAPSFLSISRDDDPLIVVNGFSKAWAMTGWRLGWVVTPTRSATHWAILSECFNTGAASFVQIAGTAALRDGESVVQDLRGRYRDAREIVMQVLASHPRIELSEPQGAFYAFPRVRGLRSSLDFVHGVLDEEDVGIAPGYTFGPHNDAHFRVCFAQSHPRLREGLERVLRYIDRHENDFASREESS